MREKVVEAVVRVVGEQVGGVGDVEGPQDVAVGEAPRSEEGRGVAVVDLQEEVPGDSAEVVEGPEDLDEVAGHKRKSAPIGWRRLNGLGCRFLTIAAVLLAGRR